MKREIKNFLLFFLLTCVMACQDEKQAPISMSVVGKWAGQTADIKANPDGIIPAFTLRDKPLPVVIEFRSDGTMTLTDSNNKTYEGSYSQAENKLELTIDYQFEFVDLTGEYNIDELTNEKMTVSSSRSGTFDVPGYGQFDGSISPTLHFARASN